jgi:glutathione peroxidase
VVWKSSLSPVRRIYVSARSTVMNFVGNNFLYQEPGTDTEIVKFAREKGAEFPVFDKVDCGTSEEANPLFPFLCNKVPDSGFFSNILGNGLKWNFEKFLCDEEGFPIKRFSPAANPISFEDEIVSMLGITVALESAKQTVCKTSSCELKNSMINVMF